MPNAGGKHRNDTYGNVGEPQTAKETHPAVPAATVVLLRDAPTGPEALMLRKNSKINFGGMWVFPGGRIDPEDRAEGNAEELAARNAAAREAREEAGACLEPAALLWFAHWTPPPGTPVRFTTWFFAAKAGDEAVRIDGSEIKAHQWIRPVDALAKHKSGAIDLAPPTWVTLNGLSAHSCVDSALGSLADRPPRIYATRVARRNDGVRVALWEGDAGYVDGDADRQGPRHRLVMTANGFVFENNAAHC